MQFNKLMGETRAELKERLNYSPEVDHDTMWKAERWCAAPEAYEAYRDIVLVLSVTDRF